MFEQLNKCVGQKWPWSIGEISLGYPSSGLAAYRCTAVQNPRSFFLTFPNYRDAPREEMQKVFRVLPTIEFAEMTGCESAEVSAANHYFGINWPGKMPLGLSFALFTSSETFLFFGQTQTSILLCSCYCNFLKGTIRSFQIFFFSLLNKRLRRNTEALSNKNYNPIRILQEVPTALGLTAFAKASCWRFFVTFPTISWFQKRRFEVWFSMRFPFAWGTHNCRSRVRFR